MPVDLEQMNVTMNARFDQFSRQLAKTDADFGKRMNSILAKKRSTEKSLSLSLPGAGKFLGLDKMGGALAGLTGVAVVGGLGELITKSLDAAKAVGEVAAQAGIAPERLQTLRYAASQSQASFGDMDEALINFNKNFGEFINTGGGKGANAFKNLGIDKMINSGEIRTAEQAWDAFLAKIRAIPNEAQRIAYASNLMGKEVGPKLAAFIDAGATAISALEAKARSLGIVLSAETIRGADEARDKLDTLFSVIKIQGVNAIAHLAPEISDLAQRLTDSLPSLIAWVEHWADWFGLIKQSPMAKLQYDVDAAKANVDDLVKRMNGPWYLRMPAKWFDPAIKQAIVDYKAAKKAKDDYEADHANRYDTHLPINPFAPPRLHSGSTQSERDAAAKQAEELAQKHKEMMDKLGVDQATADAALVADQNKLTVKLLTGQTGYYDAVEKMIVDDMNAKLAVIDSEEKSQIDSLGKQGTAWKGYAEAVAKAHAIADAKRGSLQADVNTEADDKLGGAFDRDSETQAARQIQSYKDQIVNLGLVEGALVAAAYYQDEYNKQIEAGIPPALINTDLLRKQAAAVGQAAQAQSDAAKLMQQSVQVQDDIRTGLEDTGAAGVKGFKALKSAAADFLMQLAMTIAKLYVMKPLVEGLLGAAGGNGGGLLGDALSNALGTPSGSSAAAGPLLMEAGTSLNFAAKALISAASALGGSGIGGNFLSDIFGGGSDGTGITGALDLGGGNGGLFGMKAGGVFVHGQGTKNLKRFRNGGVSKDAAIFGEAGAEAAVPLPDGRSIPVALRLPSARQLGRGAANFTANTSLNIDARGAQIGVAEQLRAAGPALVEASVKAMRREFAANMAKHMIGSF